MESHPELERRLWLFSRRSDFWLACGGASAAILAAVALISFHGDRELDALDFVLSEFHLGATYDAVLRRRLWHHRRIDVLAAPFLILALTYFLSFGGQQILLTSIAMYAAVWHRGRQSFGIARFYQRRVGGPASRLHDFLFRGAVYLPMLAAALAYTHIAPREYEGERYLALDLGAEATAIIGGAAALCVAAYLAWLFWGRFIGADRTPGLMIHPGEWWIVLAHAAAFGSSYALGASNASFLLVLAVHHEVQYLYFTYAMARRPAAFPAAIVTNAGRFAVSPSAKWRADLKHAASFLVWPVLGFAGALAGGWLQLSWIAPLGVGGLFCHYWLDARIWTRRAFQN
ncbi:MAG TPA: hypothetical protein VGH50_16585 [Candidatus Binatia bacterium]